MARRPLTPQDLTPIDQYRAQRTELRLAHMRAMRARRVAIGPHALAQFENRASIRHHVQEMLAIEEGGADATAHELAAYNPLIPNGGELVATFVLEFDDPAGRAAALEALSGAERSVYLVIAGERITAEPEPAGAPFNVHFVRFPLSGPQASAFKSGPVDLALGVDHSNYRHRVVIPQATWAALASDLA